MANVSGFDSQLMNYGTDIVSIKHREDVKAYLYGLGSIHVAYGAGKYVSVGDFEEIVDGYKRLVADVSGM